MIRSARKVPLNFYKFIENRMKNDELFSDDNLANKRTGESLSQYFMCSHKAIRNISHHRYKKTNNFYYAHIKTI